MKRVLEKIVPLFWATITICWLWFMFTSIVDERYWWTLSFAIGSVICGYFCYESLKYSPKICTGLDQSKEPIYCPALGLTINDENGHDCHECRLYPPPDDEEIRMMISRVENNV